MLEGLFRAVWMFHTFPGSSNICQSRFDATSFAQLFLLHLVRRDLLTVCG